MIEQELVPSSPLCEEAKARLKKSAEKKEERLKKMKEDYENK